jgi:hypothetical protein
MRPRLRFCLLGAELIWRGERRDGSFDAEEETQEEDSLPAKAAANPRLTPDKDSWISTMLEESMSICCCMAINRITRSEGVDFPFGDMY